MTFKELIRIENDGTAKGTTRVVDVRTGELIGLVQSLKWEIDAETQIPKCTIVAYGVPIRAEAEAEITLLRTKQEEK